MDTTAPLTSSSTALVAGVSALIAAAILVPLAGDEAFSPARTPGVATRAGPAQPAAPPIQPVDPFTLKGASAQAATAAADCLADAVYYEAGFEPLDGQRAVAQVVLNRVRDRNFPKSVCGVVYEGWKKRTGCQFSFACDGSVLRRAPDSDEWRHALDVAKQALGGYVMAAVGTATHYHTLAVHPWWQSTVVKVAQVGSQIFYRWPGHAGQVDALQDNRYDGDEVRISQADYKKLIVPRRARKAADRHEAVHRRFGPVQFAMR